MFHTSKHRWKGATTRNPSTLIASPLMGWVRVFYIEGRMVIQRLDGSFVH